MCRSLNFFLSAKAEKARLNLQPTWYGRLEVIVVLLEGSRKAEEVLFEIWSKDLISKIAEDKESQTMRSIVDLLVASTGTIT